MSLDKAKPKDTPVKNKPVDKPAPKPADRSQPKTSQIKDAGRDKSGGSKIDLKAIRNKTRDTKKRNTDQTQPQSSAIDKVTRKSARPNVDLKAVRAKMRDGSKTDDQLQPQSSAADKAPREKGAAPNVDLKAAREKTRQSSKSTKIARCKVRTRQRDQSRHLHWETEDRKPGDKTQQGKGHMIWTDRGLEYDRDEYDNVFLDTNRGDPPAEIPPAEPTKSP